LVYAAIRIVDNSSMINLNTAAAYDTDNNGAVDDNDLFSPTNSDPNRQLRGRRGSEVCVDGPWPRPAAADTAAILDNDRSPLPAFVTYRGLGGATSMYDPGSVFTTDVVRRLLLGGNVHASDSAYGVLRPADELALRGRNVLGSYVGGNSGAWSTAEQSLPQT